MMTGRSMAKSLTGLSAALLVCGCATNPDKMETAYVSPLQYSQYDCAQIGAEQGHVERRTGELYTKLRKDANNDAAQMTVGMLLFWPALFFLEGGDGPEAAEYSRLKGEYEALRTVAVEKKCGLEFAPDLAAKAEEDYETEKNSKKD